MSQGPYLSLLAALERANVRYAIAGGFAVVLHGVPRMTFDLDLVVDLEDDNLARLISVLEGQGYQPRLPVPLRDMADPNKRREWTQQRHLVTFSLFHPDRTIEEVDVLLQLSVPWSDIAASLVRKPLQSTGVSVVGRQVLRRMKLATGRDKDRADAELLGDGDD